MLVRGRNGVVAGLGLVQIWACAGGRGVSQGDRSLTVVSAVSLPPLLPADIAGKFAASSWGKKLAARSAKANMTDLDRYKAMVAKCKRSRLVRTAFNKLKKSA